MDGRLEGGRDLSKAAVTGCMVKLTMQFLARLSLILIHVSIDRGMFHVNASQLNRFLFIWRKASGG